jgi:hypothetical protein
MLSKKAEMKRGLIADIRDDEGVREIVQSWQRTSEPEGKITIQYWKLFSERRAPQLEHFQNKILDFSF